MWKRDSHSFRATEHPTSTIARDHICRNWNDRCCQWNWRGLGSIVVVWLNDDQMKYRWLSLTEDVFTLELFAKKKKNVAWSQHGLTVILVHVFHFDIISWTAVRIMLIVPSGNIHHQGLFIIWFKYLKAKAFPSCLYWNISNIAKGQLFQRSCS